MVIKGEAPFLVPKIKGSSWRKLYMFGISLKNIIWNQRKRILYSTSTKRNFEDSRKRDKKV
jgi:hypothetical protein